MSTPTKTPRVVIVGGGFGGKTVLASPDHYQAMQITDAAVFYSRIDNLMQSMNIVPVSLCNQPGLSAATSCTQLQNIAEARHAEGHGRLEDAGATRH